MTSSTRARYRNLRHESDDDAHGDEDEHDATVVQHHQTVAAAAYKAYFEGDQASAPNQSELLA